MDSGSADLELTPSEQRDGELLAEAGRNVWRVARAERYALLLDGAEYFRRLRQALLGARRDVFLLGWDFDLRLELVRGPGARAAGDDAPTRLGDLLNHIVTRRPPRPSRRFTRPRVHVLAWDFSSLFALERQPLAMLLRGLGLHRRVRHEFDAKHPLGAAHHQKLVVVDDVLAFVSGMDLTSERWDTDAHLCEDPGRSEPGTPAYPPHHDLTAMVSGEAAQALGELARERWQRASRRRLRPPRPAKIRDLWPADLEPDFCDVPLAIARTRPAFGGEDALREVEQLFLDSFARARRTIYLETQYLTSRAMSGALARRLSEPDGPEVVLVHPSEPAGFFEQWVLGDLIRAAHAELRGADEHGRLRIVRPLASRSQDLEIYVHSKIAIVDDRWLRVGSANLNQRSMGLDTECDVLVEAQDEAACEGLRRVRERLIGHWVGASPEEVRAAITETGSLGAAIDRLGGGERGLEPLDLGPADAEEVDSLRDLDEPIEPTRLIDRFLPELVQGGTLRGRGPEAVMVGAVLLVTLTALAWRFTPLGEALPPETLDRMQERLDALPATPLVVLSIYWLGTLPLFPVHLLILVTVLVLGGLQGGGYALAGTLFAAAGHFGLGRLLGGPFLLRVAGGRFERFAAKLRRGGASAVVALRLLPVAPFVIVNLACAVSRMSLGAYLGGTLLGSLPVVLGIALFGAQVRAVLRSGTFLETLILVLIAAGFTWLVWLLQRFLVDHELGGEQP